MLNNLSSKVKMSLFAFYLFVPIISKGQTFTFNNPLPIPYTMSGSSAFVIDINGSTHNFDPNGAVTNINLNVPLTSYCYNQINKFDMTYLGPTLIMEKDEVQNMDIANFLPNNVNTTVHWHGLNIPARMDGGPHQIIKNGFNWLPSFKMIDPVQTGWYHTHLMDQTTDQVIRGLAGMIIIEDQNDPIRNLLPRDYGINDIPIIIQEKDFVLDSTTMPPTATAIIAGEKPGNGPYTLVNGVVGGFMKVPPEIVRLRILNGSPRKMFNIGLSTEYSKPSSFAKMHMIATGGGYLENTVAVDSTLMSVGDRREFLVDFSLYPDGDTIYMTNLQVPADARYGKTPGNALMAFIVADEIFPANPISTIPTNLDNNYSLSPGLVFKERTKQLMGNPTGNGEGGVWTIDGTPMNLGTINDTVLVNTKERWTIVNTTTKAHPFHIHKVQFQVVEYTGKIGAGNTEETVTFPNLPSDLIGYKDVQLIRGGATMVFEARFDSFPSPLFANEGYMYHCHILTHEDTSMMHQFVVVDSVDFFVGLSNIPNTEPLVIYPNPANSQISFKGDYDEPGKLIFYDLLGRVLFQEEVSNLSAAQFSVIDLPKGVIVVEFSTKTKHYVSKILLN